MSSLYLIERETLKNSILSLCEKVNYIVKVSKVSIEKGGGKVLTLFPERKFGHPIQVNNELIHEIEKKSNYFNVRRYDKGKWKTFNLPDYIVRPFIIQDIYLKCGFLGIDQDLVIGYDENDKKVKRIIDAIPEPEGIDKEKELKCAKLYTMHHMGQDVKKEAEKLGVLKGMEFIDGFLRKTAEKFLNEEILD